MKFNKKTKIRLSAGHLLVIWDVIANKLSQSSFREVLNDDEMRALWALQDLCEDQIGRIGITPKPEREWALMMASARKHVKTIPVQFLK